jgi:uncharacterized protein YjbJ (UPF0337 family)
MNWDQIEGNRKQTGRTRELWGERTEDNLDHVQGNRAQRVGLMQDNCGTAEQDAQRDGDGWRKDS